MKFKNLTSNSIYLEDIDHYISFDENEVYELSLEDIKKSSSFQNLIVLGALEVIEHDESRLENNLLHFANERSNASTEAEEKEPRMLSNDQPEVIIKGHFYEAGGYAKVNRNLTFGLAKLGVKVEINPLSLRRNDLNELEVRALANFKQRVGREAIRIDNIIPSFSEISSCRTHRILYTTIEAGSVRQQVVDVCNQYHEIWVTADFCKEVLEKAGVQPNVYVMPPGINTSLYHEDYEPHQFRPALKNFVFCSLGQWQYRKGWDALLRSYLTEFSGNDDVSLLLIARHQFGGRGGEKIRKEVSEAIKKYGGKNPAHIVRCSRVIPEHELPRVYIACNVFVLPSRGEGFGLPYCEASLCGLPVVATNHSAHTMFLKGNNSILVDPDKIERIPRGTTNIHYWDEQLFASLKSDHFCLEFGGAMRDSMVYYKEAKERNKLLQAEIKSKYSISASSKRVKSRIDEIWKSIRS